MKRSVFGISFAVVCGLASAPIAAAPDPLTAWFIRATAYNTQVAATKMSRPELLPGKPSAMTCRYERGRPALAAVWQLLRYDRTHHLAFATATTDECSVALFRAPAPPAAVPNADLSGYSTRLGLRVGSTYEQVRSAYGGGPMKGAGHFVAAYTSSVPGQTISLPHERIDNPEMATIVVDDGRVSSISVYINIAGEF